MRFDRAGVWLPPLTALKAAKNELHVPFSGSVAVAYRKLSIELFSYVIQSSPKLFKPGRVGCCVDYGMLNVSVAQIILDKSGVCPCVGKGVTACVAEHVRV